MKNLHRVLAPIAAAAALLGAVAAHAAPNLVQNGSFETPAVDPLKPYGAVNGFNYLGGTDLTNWTIANGGGDAVLFNATYNPVSDGLQAVQIEDVGTTLSQTFATQVGAQYVLQFALSSWNAASSTVRATLSGVGSFDFAQAGTAYATMTQAFTAAGTSTTLTFENRAWYPQIDAVSVTAVPEPGGLVLALAGLAVVGTLAARRRDRG